MTKGNEERRGRFQDKGYAQIEVWVPEDVKRKLHALKALRGERSVNDVIVDALQRYVDVELKVTT